MQASTQTHSHTGTRQLMAKCVQRTSAHPCRAGSLSLTLCGSLFGVSVACGTHAANAAHTMTLKINTILWRRPRLRPWRCRGDCGPFVRGGLSLVDDESRPDRSVSNAATTTTSPCAGRAQIELRQTYLCTAVDADDGGDDDSRRLCRLQRCRRRRWRHPRRCRRDAAAAAAAPAAGTRSHIRSDMIRWCSGTPSPLHKSLH